MFVEKLDSTLDHVYFFINDRRPSTASTGDSNQCGTPRSEIASVDSNDTEATTAVSGMSSLGSWNLNPHAKTFNPPTSPCDEQSNADCFELRKTADRGYGLFATTAIPIGTRIICEAPLIRIPERSLHLASPAYETLSNAQKATFDKLHFFQPQHLDLEQVSHFNLIDYSDNRTEDDDFVDELVAKHIRVMGIFSANSFAAGDGLAVFETTSRINHSCVPNVHHSYNPSLQKQTVHAERDISPGEELCTTYFGGPDTYYLRSQRIEILRSDYGFTCACPACADSTGISDSRRQLMGSLAWGLQQFLERNCLGMTHVPTSSSEALQQAEALIHLLLQEGLFSGELIRAYRTASAQALNAGVFQKAMDYAKHEAEVERNCLGTELADLVQLGMASTCWMEHVLSTAAAAGFQFEKHGNLENASKSARSENKAKKNMQKKRAKALKKKEQEREANRAKEVERVARKEIERQKKEAAKKQNEYDTSFPSLAG